MSLYSDRWSIDLNTPHAHDRLEKKTASAELREHNASGLSPARGFATVGG